VVFFYLLISIMPLIRHPLWSEFVGDLTLVKYLGLPCILYAFWHLIQRRTSVQLLRSWQTRWFLLLAALGTISFLTNGARIPWEQSPLMSYVSFIFLWLVTLVVVDSRHRLRLALLTAVGSVAFASLYVLREWQKNPGMRPGSVTGDANYFTTSALLCLPLAFYLMQEKRPRWQQWFCAGCLSLTLVAVALASSRGGFLGLVTAALFTIWRSRRRAQGLVALSLGLAATLVSPIAVVERFLNPTYGDQVAMTNRSALWGAGLSMIWEHPVVGIGAANFKPRVEQYATRDDTPQGVAHNTYIEMAAELGIPGLLAFVGVLLATIRSLERVRRRTLRSGPSLLHRAAQGMQTGLIGYAVAIFFMSAQYQKLLWLVVFLSACLPPLAAATTLVEQQRKLSPRLG
jgi:putative inorganic carbon (hco3(-)) transporter